MIGAGIHAHQISADNVVWTPLAKCLTGGAGLCALLTAFGLMSGAHLNSVVYLPPHDRADKRRYAQREADLVLEDMPVPGCPLLHTRRRCSSPGRARTTAASSHCYDAAFKEDYAAAQAPYPRTTGSIMVTAMCMVAAAVMTRNRHG